MSKPFKEIWQQIEILEGRQLRFKDKSNAEFVLINNSYYGVINKFKDMFIKPKDNEDDEDDFNGTYFEDFIILYDFDKELSVILYKYMSTIETTLKSSLAYSVGKNIGYLQSSYLSRYNYEPGIDVTYKGRPQKSREVTLEKIKKSLQKTDNDSVKHYKQKYNEVPPWITTICLPLGTMYEWYRILDSDSKTEICDVFLYEETEEMIKKDLFFKSLKNVHIFRNCVAHGSRVLNHQLEQKHVISKSYFATYTKEQKNSSALSNGKGSGITGLMISIALLLSNRNTVKMRFIRELENAFEDFENDNKILFDKTMKTYKIPKNIFRVLRSI